MTRLTNALKNVIIKNAFNAANITSERETIRLREEKWTENVRLRSICTKKTSNVKTIQLMEKAFKDYKELIKPFKTNTVHKGIFVGQRRVCVNITGKRVIAYFRDTTAPYSPTIRHSGPEVILLCNDPLTKEWVKTQELIEKVEFKATTLHRKLSTLFQGVTTVNALIKLWPEVKELLPKDISKPKTTAIAINTKDLNSLCNLIGKS